MRSRRSRRSSAPAAAAVRTWLAPAVATRPTPFLPRWRHSRRGSGNGWADARPHRSGLMGSRAALAIPGLAPLRRALLRFGRRKELAIQRSHGRRDVAGLDAEHHAHLA